MSWRILVLESVELSRVIDSVHHMRWYLPVMSIRHSKTGDRGSSTRETIICSLVNTHTNAHETSDCAREVPAMALERLQSQVIPANEYVAYTGQKTKKKTEETKNTRNTQTMTHK
ncbi:hypothetical protein L1987_78680 [Smallanthus sonchifolius]|uniref:Uncharacterized protein n=1 Tax=Smallanthus sonchifolius TaxID=185202 RepID=A0ACB8ZEE0_9ASTR|nr:hypothetical protein L1987_78680 [Smallanthus sonchifolius]